MRSVRGAGGRIAGKRPERVVRPKAALWRGWYTPEVCLCLGRGVLSWPEVTETGGGPEMAYLARLMEARDLSGVRLLPQMSSWPEGTRVGRGRGGLSARRR